MTSPSSPPNSSSADSTDSVAVKPTRSSLDPLPQLRPYVLQGWRFWIMSVLTLSIVWLLIPLDVSISNWFIRLDIPGDIEKDMDAFQQFGQFGSVIFVIVLSFTDKLSKSLFLQSSKASLKESGHIFQVSFSESMKIRFAFSYTAGLQLPINVKDWHKTVSPSDIPNTRIAR